MRLDSFLQVKSSGVQPPPPLNVALVLVT